MSFNILFVWDLLNELGARLPVILEPALAEQFCVLGTQRMICQGPVRELFSWQYWDIFPTCIPAEHAVGLPQGHVTWCMMSAQKQTKKPAVSYEARR